MRKYTFQSYLSQIATLTVQQREFLMRRLTEQTSQEAVLSQIVKRIEEDLECPYLLSLRPHSTLGNHK